MKDLETLMLLMNERNKPTTGAWISSTVVLLLIGIGFLIAAAITREVLWLLVGGGWTLLSIIILAILIPINIRRNKPRF